MIKHSPFFSLLFVFISLCVLVACGGPEVKKAQFFEKGKGFYEQGDYVKARLELKNAIQIDLEYAEAYYYLGLTELKSGNPRQAYGALAKAVELNPALMDAQLELGKLFNAARAPEQALQKADLVLAKDPDNTDALILKSAVLLRLDKGEEARSLLMGLVDKGVTQPQVFLQLASLEDKLGKKDKAIAWLTKGSKANPDEPIFYVYLSRFAVRDKKMDEAVSLLQKVVALAPDKAEYQLNLASLLWDLDRRDEATALLASASSDDVEKQQGLIARFYISKNESKRAEDSLKKALAENQKSFQLRFMLSELYIRDKRVDEAIVLLNECLTLDSDPAAPAILTAKNGLAKIYFNRGETAKATALIEEVLKDNPKSVEAHFIRGNLYLQAGDGESAVSEFRVTITEQPQFIEGYLRLAEAHFLNKEIELGGETLQKAYEVNPDSKEVLQTLVKYYALKRDAAAAEAVLKDYLSRHEDDAQVRAVLGDFYMMEEKEAEGLAEYEKLIADKPGDASGYIRLSGYHWRKGEKEKAVAIVEKAYGDNKASLPLFSTLVQLYLAEKQYEKAIMLCQKRLKGDPSDAVVYTVLGRVYMAKNDFDSAEQSFVRAIELKPDWIAAHNSLAALYVKNGKTDEAIAKFEQALEVNPNRGEVYISLAMLYEQTDKYDKAMATYEAALAKNANFWPAANNLAFLLSEHPTGKDDMQRALKLAEQAREIRPQQPEILDTLGWVYFKMGNTGRAEEIFKEALAVSPESAVLNYHLGMVYVAEGRTKEAKQYLQAALDSGEVFSGIDKAKEIVGAMK